MSEPHFQLKPASRAHGLNTASETLPKGRILSYLAFRSAGRILQLPSGTQPSVLRLIPFKKAHLSSPAVLIIFKTMMVHICLAPCGFRRLAHGVSHFLFEKAFCPHHPLNLQAGAATSFLAEDCSCYYLPSRGYTVHPTPYSWEHWHLPVQAYKIILTKGRGVHSQAILVTACWAMNSPNWKLCHRTKGTVLAIKTTFSSQPGLPNTCAHPLGPSMWSSNCFTSL